MSVRRRADSAAQHPVGVAYRDFADYPGRHSAPTTETSPVTATPTPTPSTAIPSAASAEFRAVMGNFATGVTVVTALDGSTPAGFTCQTFTSLSLDPPLISFAASRASSSRLLILDAGRFCVNILAFDQRRLCTRFATRGVDRFEGVSWWHAPSGSPILDGVLAWVDCAVEAEYPAGDHMIVIGRVMDLSYLREAAPLVYHRGEYANCFPAIGSTTLPRVS